MMGEKEPETCWATHKRQVINLWKSCILLVSLFKFYFCSLSLVYLTSSYQQQMSCSEKLVGTMNWEVYGRVLVCFVPLSICPLASSYVCGKERNPYVALRQISSVLYQGIPSSPVPFMHSHRLIRWNIAKNLEGRDLFSTLYPKEQSLVWKNKTDKCLI
jgi:hypothetical protein